MKNQKRCWSFDLLKQCGEESVLDLCDIEELETIDFSLLKMQKEILSSRGKERNIALFRRFQSLQSLSMHFHLLERLC